jgi:hypothetical protein
LIGWAGERRRYRPRCRLGVRPERRVVRVMGKIYGDVEREKLDIYADRQRRRDEDRLRQEIEHRERAVGFPASPVFTGEDAGRFDRLLNELVVEYQPQGPAQVDAVNTMAGAIWRKQNLGTFQRAAEARMRWGNYFRYPNDQGGVIKFVQEALQAIADEAERVFKAGDGGETRDGAAAPAGKQSNKGGDTKVTNVHNQTKEESKPFVICSDRHAAMQINEVMDKIEKEWREGFGPPTGEIAANAAYVLEQIMLAMQGDLLTPECYLAELRMAGELDRVIERSHARLMKLKASKSRPAIPLIPAWVPRRR